MREQQLEIIERVLPKVTTLPVIVQEAEIVADFYKTLERMFIREIRLVIIVKSSTMLSVIFLNFLYHKAMSNLSLRQHSISL